MLGIGLRRVGSTYRVKDGGENAFAVYPDSSSWFDFKLNITDLVAFFKFDGDKKQALLELLPDRARQIDCFLEDCKKFIAEVEDAHNYILNILNDPEHFG